MYRPRLRSSLRRRQSSATTFCMHIVACWMLTLPRHRRRTTLGRRAVAVAGPTVWNSLPDQLRISDCIHSTFWRSRRHSFSTSISMCWGAQACWGAPRAIQGYCMVFGHPNCPRLPIASSRGHLLKCFPWVRRKLVETATSIQGQAMRWWWLVCMFSALEVYTIMRYINPHFTYLLIYFNIYHI